ncbi:tail fiber domain-containing protein [Hyphomicrobium sp. DY-1]|uniref:tail fiber domain-containing protein n=1 Tax=Hyphomicrobium sp. DY-1 TaxID=3075650 RepID=UPI0039C25E9E
MCLLLLGLLIVAQTAHAACANPAGVAGDMTYSTSANVMVFCDSNNWVSMAGGVSLTVNTSGGGGATPAGSTSDVQFNNGGALSADTGNFTYSAGLLKAPNISATAITASGAGNFGTLNSSGLATLGSLIVTGGATITGQASITTVSTSLLQLGNNGATCTSGLAGAQRYNNVSNTIDYCTGTAWMSLGPSSTTPVAFQVSKNADQTVTASQHTKLTWQTEEFDTNNNFAADRFTATIPGFYLINLNVFCTTNITNGSCQAEIWKNGSPVKYGVGRADSAGAGGVANAILYLGVGDYVEGYAFDDGVTIQSSSGQKTFMNGVLLAPQGGGSGGTATPAGSTADVQFNSGGLLAADTGNFTYTSSTLKTPSLLTGGITATGQASLTTVSSTLVQLISNTTTACTAGIAGAQRYNSVSNTIDYCTGTGWMSMGPSSTQPISFLANKGGTDQTVTTDTTVQLTFGNVVYDTNNNFSSNAFTASVPGKYIFSVQVWCADSTTYCDAYIYKNGVSVAQNYVATSVGSSSGVTTILDIAAGDVVKAYVQNRHGTSVGGSTAQTYFAGALLSPQGSGSGGTATPAGSTADVQFNSGGLLAADTGNFTYASSTLKTPSLLTGGITATGQASLTTISTSLIQVGNNGASCTNGISGSLRYSSVSSTMEYCNGSNWSSMGPSATVAYMLKTQASAQGSVTAAGTVIVFDTVTNSGGTDITATGNRIVLAPGSSYLLQANVAISNASTTSNMIYKIYDATNNVAVGSPGSAGFNWGNDTYAQAFVTPSVSTAYEVRVLAVNGGASGITNGGSSFSAIKLGGGGSGGFGGGTANPAGSTADIQFNSAGALAADTGRFTYVSSTGLLSAPTVSASAISGTLIQAGTSSATCGTGLLGSMRYANDTLEVCASRGWVGLVSGSTMPVFTCPAGFTLMQSQGQTMGCIQNSDEGTDDCISAINACWSNYGGRLPTYSELTAAVGAGIVPFTTSEWTGEASYGSSASCGEKSTTSSRPTASTYSSNVSFRCFIPANGIISGTSTSGSALASMTDVTLDTLSNNDLLQYNSGSSKWVNVSASSVIPSPDRITSGTLAVTANSATSYISLSTNGTDWGYLNSTNSYLPKLSSANVSSTLVSASTISATDIEVGAGGACTAANAGKIRYNATSNTLQVCPASGVWTSLSSSTTGGAGVSAMASLTDVQLTNLAGRDYLRYDAGTSKWVNISESTVMSTTTIVSNWPDAIACTNGSGTRILAQQSVGATQHFYAAIDQTPTAYGVFFSNTTQAYASQQNMTGYDCVTNTWSIPQLYAQGKAFNFIGNANTGGTALGDRITSGTLAMTVNSATSYISLSTGGTDWGYLNSANSYLPKLSSGNISSTLVSASTVSTTLLHLISNTTTACTGSLAGAQRYNSVSNTIDYCSGTAWLSLGPSATVVPSFAAYKAAATQSIAYNTITKVTFDAETFDTNNNFSGSRFTVTIPGTYLFTGAIRFVTSNDAGRGIYAYLEKNGSIVGGQHIIVSNGLYNNVGFALVVNAQVGDYFELFAQQNGGSSGNIDVYNNNFTYFTGSLLTMNGGGPVGSATPAGNTADVQFNSSGLLAADTGNFTYASGTLQAPAVSATVLNSQYLSATTIYNPGTLSGNTAAFNSVSSTLVSASLIQLVSTSTTTCTGGTVGSIRYASDTIQVCATTGWTNLSSSSTVGGGATPAGSTKDVQFNSGGGLAADTGKFTYTSVTGVLSATTVSASTISSTYIQLPSATTVLACGNGAAGTMRYTSGTMQVCDGSGWTNVGIGIPQGTISAFAFTSCPNGWSEYTPARGRFLRGIDNGAGVDPSGTRVPGATQVDTLQNITGSFRITRGQAGNAAGAFSIDASVSGGNHGTGTANNYPDVSLDASLVARTSTETRPANVAVIFCQYSGYQSQQMVGPMMLASLSDVSVAGAISGSVLTYSNGTWIAGAGNAAIAAGATNDVQFKNSGGGLSADTGRFTYVSSTGLLSAPTVSASAISGTLIQAGTSIASCGSGLQGAMRYASNTMQVCTTGGWTSLSSALSNLADVNITNLSARDYLRYDLPSSKWVNISESTVMSTTTVVPTFPDAITCSGSSGFMRLDLAVVDTSGKPDYRFAGSTSYRVIFNADGSFNTYAGTAYTASCNGQSISQLYASGNAFNYIGSSQGAANPAGMSGALQYNSSGLFGADTNNLYWDATNHRLGLGNTVPGVTLDISTSSAIRTYQVFSANNLQATLLNYNQLYTYNGPLYLNYSSTSNTLINANGGNVGIGTTAPGGTLEVSGSNALRLSGTDTTHSPYIEWYSSGTRQAYMGWGTPGSSFNITLENSNALNVTAASTVFSGNVTAVAYLYASDRRLKSDITSLTGGLSKLDELNPVSFYYKADPSRTTHLGLIAQDVRKVYPQAVHTNEKGFLSVDYPSLVGPIFEMLKELKAMVFGDHAAIAKLDANGEKLQAANDNLEVEVEALKAQNEFLKAANENLARRVGALEKRARGHH